MRAAAIILVASAGAAGAVAVASRAPAELRDAEPDPAAFDAAHGDTFSETAVARGRAYRRPAYLSLVLSLLLEAVVLVVLLRGPFARAVASVDRLPGGWIVHAAVLAAGLSLVLALAALPLAFARGFVVEHAWGMSTQDLGGWLSDRARSGVVGAVVSLVAATAFFAIVRLAGQWWTVALWAGLTALTVVFTFVWPVVVAPLFNEFTPLEDAALANEVRDLASGSGVSVDEVLVADASRRTTAENAYVAGLGTTKRVVIYDTLLAAAARDETLFVVAHELGHEARGHIVKNVSLTSAGLGIGIALLAWAVNHTGFLRWVGASSLIDLRVLPALALLSLVFGVITMPVQSAISRAYEREADEHALALTGRPDVAVGAFRRLAVTNIADLDPPRIVVAWWYSHPPIRERIQAALAERSPSE